MKCLLTVAGLDPSAGAGLSMDLAVFGSQGFHGLCVPTALVVQGPWGVEAMYPAPEGEFQHALAVLAHQVENIAGVKVGVLASPAQVKALADFLRERPDLPLVVDPIMEAKNGFRLTPPETVNALLEEIFPLGPVVTPNLPEAAALTGRAVATLKDMEEAAKILLSMGARAVVITGGHLNPGETKQNPRLHNTPIVDHLSTTTDLFFAGGEACFYTKPRVSGEIHGTGCLFSALVLTKLAHGFDPEEAFLAAEEEIGEVMPSAYPLGLRGAAAGLDAAQAHAQARGSTHSHGYLYTNPALVAGQQWQRARVLAALWEAARDLAALAPVELVPAVQMNLGFALPGAQGPEEVAAFPGRIGAHAGQLLFKGDPVFGASSHVARLILTAMCRFPHVRACLNLKVDDRVLTKARALGYTVLEADRGVEPPTVSETEGRSLDFLMQQVLAGASRAPDIVFDRGAHGKEPMIRLFGRTPQEVIEKLKAVKP